LDAVDARHIEIHEDDVGLERGRQGDGFVPSHRLTNYLGGWLCLQQRTQPIAKDGVIIGNQDANTIHDESPCAHLRCHAPDGSGSTTQHGNTRPRSSGSYELSSDFPPLHNHTERSYTRGDNGSWAYTRVPPSAIGSMRHVPPSSMARSCMEVSPTPTRNDVGSPIPSSVISRESISPKVRGSVQVRAWACRMT